MGFIKEIKLICCWIEWFNG